MLQFWPQFVYVAIAFTRLVTHFLHHGKPTNIKYDFWGVLLWTAFLAVLLYCGGFFR